MRLCGHEPSDARRTGAHWTGTGQSVFLHFDGDTEGQGRRTVERRDAPRYEDSEEFYKKVAKILDEEGEISGVISRLADREVYDTLSYEEQQRYNLNLSEKYLKALERYKKEKALKI